MHADDCTQRCMFRDHDDDDGQTVLISAAVHFCLSSAAFIHHLLGWSLTPPLLLTYATYCRFGCRVYGLLCTLVPLQRWMRLLYGRRSCSRWRPHHCPSSPRPLPHTVHPCPLSAGTASCWGVAREAAAATADLPAHPQPPLPSPPHPAEGRWRAAVLAG